MVTKSDLKPGAQFYLRNPFNIIEVVKIHGDKVFFITTKMQDIATYCSIEEAMQEFKKVGEK